MAKPKSLGFWRAFDRANTVLAATHMPRTFSTQVAASANQDPKAVIKESLKQF